MAQRCNACMTSDNNNKKIMKNNEPRIDFSANAPKVQQQPAEPNVKEDRDFAFGKTNFIIIGISMIIVVIGYCLMTGAESNTEKFDAEIFSSMRVSIAPVITLVGFLLIICGIMYKPSDKR